MPITFDGTPARSPSPRLLYSVTECGYGFFNLCEPDSIRVECNAHTFRLGVRVHAVDSWISFKHSHNVLLAASTVNIRNIEQRVYARPAPRRAQRCRLFAGDWSCNCPTLLDRCGNRLRSVWLFGE
jgi:hypothetical protein